MLQNILRLQESKGIGEKCDSDISSSTKIDVEIEPQMEAGVLRTDLGRSKCLSQADLILRRKTFKNNLKQKCIT